MGDEKLVPVPMPEITRLQQIAAVLLQAVDSPYYTTGHPHAATHLAQHVVMALEDIDLRLKLLEKR